MRAELPQLGYAYNALEPFIDAMTMEVHHSKHHQAYTDKTNAVLEKYPDLNAGSVEDLIRDIDKLDISGEDRVSLRNNGGGYINHALFWKVIDPTNQRDEKLVQEISDIFGSVDVFKEAFTKAALGQFGSGWAWLVRDGNGKLEVYSTLNQDSPLSNGHTPIIALDVWEHAYYLRYQNRRPEYVENFWKLLKMI